MVIGSAALSALPLMSGFFSKDAIVLATLDAPAGGIWFWLLASSASLLTAAYSMRLIFVTFFGPMQIEPQDNSRANQQIPLLLLSALAIGGGWFGLAVLDPVLPDGGLDSQQHEGLMVYVTALVPIVGIAVGYWLFSGKRENLARLTSSITSQRIAGFLKRGWDFDALYERVFVKPFVWLARVNKNDIVDTMYSLIAATARELHEVLSLTQTGGLRWYAAGMTIGLVLVITLALRLF
jgi:NADH-quinone oxidoreductase subunit L